MINESDPELSRLFAQADEQFTANLMSRIERARRIRLGRQILGAIALMVIVSLSARLILDTTAGAMRIVCDLFSPDDAELFVTPWGWAASVLIGIWVLLRSRPSRR
jgi:hypothetical protein